MSMTLVVLAAGMGSRYGGLKQLDPVGPSGETVMDYSVFDAMRAGFDRVVFVIRRDIEEAFKQVIGSRYAHKVNVEYAFQRMDDLPGGFPVPADRAKPWGTAQAVYAARTLLHEPFAVINADDFYGADSYRQIAAYLKNPPKANGKIRGVISAFVLENTLSENGAVSRGICSVGSSGMLEKVVEHTKISRRADGKIVNVNDDGSETVLAPDAPTSMNCWGFLPEFVDELEALFRQFLAEHGKELKSEFYLPFAVDALIRAGKAEVSVATSRSSWYGITYKEDKPAIMAALKHLVDSGEYPGRL